MGGKEIADLLSGISLGTFILWLLAIVTIISTICAVTIKLYKVFTKYRNAKDENEKIKNASAEHDKKIDKLGEKIDKMCDEMEQQRQINYKQVRYDIVHTCDDAISSGQISASKYKSLMEMYDEYVIVFADLKPNGYVHKLIDRVNDPKQVKITGQLDE